MPRRQHHGRRGKVEGWEQRWHVAASPSDPSAQVRSVSRNQDNVAHRFLNATICRTPITVGVATVRKSGNPREVTLLVTGRPGPDTPRIPDTCVTYNHTIGRGATWLTALCTCHTRGFHLPPARFDTQSELNTPVNTPTVKHSSSCSAALSSCPAAAHLAAYYS
jgi:hypothetical protein